MFEGFHRSYKQGTEELKEVWREVRSSGLGEAWIRIGRRDTELLTLTIEYTNVGDVALLIYMRCACCTLCSFRSRIEVCKLSYKRPLLNSPFDPDSLRRKFLVCSGCSSANLHRIFEGTKWQIK